MENKTAYGEYTNSIDALEKKIRLQEKVSVNDLISALNYKQFKML